MNPVRRILCLLDTCPCRPYEDDGGCGGQCTICGKIVGYVTREQLRRYADREFAKSQARP